MDKFEGEVEQMLDNGNQSGANDQKNQQVGQRDDQEQQPSGGGGGGFMKNMETTTEDAYINQEANQFLNKEGVPGAMDGAIDGALDAEVNKLQKEF